MRHEDFINALEICAKHHTTTVTINRPKSNFVGDLGSKEFTIHITHCVPAVVTELVKAGYMCNMEEGGLNVFKV